MIALIGKCYRQSGVEGRFVTLRLLMGRHNPASFTIDQAAYLGESDSCFMKTTRFEQAGGGQFL